MSFKQFSSNPDLPENLANLVELVQWRAVRQPEQHAFTFLLDSESDEVKITYGQLNTRAQTIAWALQSRTRPGDRAILLYQPGLEYIAAFLGCLYAGVIAVPAYLPLPDRPSVHLQAIIRDAQANLILSTDLIHLYLQHLFQSIPELVHLDWLLTDSLSKAKQRISRQHLLQLRAMPLHFCNILLARQAPQEGLWSVTRIY